MGEIGCCCLVLFFLSVATRVTDATVATTPHSENLLAALIQLENAINNSSFCFRRMKDIWQDIAKRQQLIDEMQKDIFKTLDDIAKLEFERPIKKECPAPFVKGGGGCFYWPKNVMLRNWNDARSACVILGGDLAYPKDVWAFRNWASHGLGEGWESYFLGGRADPSEEFLVHRWLDGRMVTPTDGRWSTLHFSWNKSFCLLMDNSRQKLKANDCNNFRRWYICEIKIRDTAEEI